MTYTPARHMTQVADRIDKLVDRLQTLANAEFVQVVEQLAQENPGHKILFHHGMGSMSIKITPPLVSADEEESVDVVILFEINRRRYHDPVLQRFVDLCKTCEAVEDWLVNATGIPSSEQGTIARVLRRRQGKTSKANKVNAGVLSRQFSADNCLGCCCEVRCAGLSCRKKPPTWGQGFDSPTTPWPAAFV